MYRHLLFPSDFSLESDFAFAQALDLAVRLQAKLTLLHVCRLPDLALSSPHGIYDHQLAELYQQQQLELAESRLSDYTLQLSERHLDSDLLVETGHPGEAIVATARARGCDAIVMGSRGFGPVRSALLGSTSTYVLHHSVCPILVIPWSQSAAHPERTRSEAQDEASAAARPSPRQAVQRLELGPVNPDASGHSELPAGAVFSNSDQQ